MNISDNVMKYHLRNVYFIGGTACGGKTTMAKRLAEKHGFALYTDGMNYAEHNKIVSPEFQPAMSMRFSDWNTYFNRPYVEYAQWLKDTIYEDFEMTLIDLISKSSDKKVIADVHIPLEKANRLAKHQQIIFLVAEPDLVVNDYFNRPDHKEILDCIMGLPNPCQAKQNFEKTLAYGTEKYLQELYKTNWYYIIRDENSTVENTLHLIEKHFGLI